MKFGEKLRGLREAKGLTREQLADLSVVPSGTVHGYEIGRRAPSFANVLALAKALGVTCEAFSECEDVKPEAEEPKKPTSKKNGGKK